MTLWLPVTRKKPYMNTSKLASYPFDDLFYACTAFFSRKWQLSILVYLSTGPKHFGEILKYHHGLSRKVLSYNLSKLVEKNVVNRREYKKGDVVMTEYSLTKQGKELQEILERLGEWGMKYGPDSR